MKELDIGDTIGVYRTVRILGKGAMGAVYEVVHTQLGVHYALKSFTFEGGHFDVLKDKFLAEGRVLARLRHPRVVRVFDLNFDEATRTPYFVMDLVLYKDGAPHTLADVDVADLEEEYIRQWFTELASAIDYVHAQGIIHRDIKLNNVLLTGDGHIVLSDFGVSRLFSDRLRREVSAAPTMVTEAKKSRLVLGTRGYMAPEVERGEEATPASDVYSLAVMVVYLLIGVWYEPGSRALELLETLELPWAQVLPQMLAEDPKKRPTDLGVLVQQLEVPASEARTIVRSGRQGRQGRSPARKLPKWKWTAVIGAGLAAVVVAVSAAWFAFRDSVHPPAADDALDAFSAEGIFEVLK